MRQEHSQSVSKIPSFILKIDATSSFEGIETFNTGDIDLGYSNLYRFFLNSDFFSTDIEFWVLCKVRQKNGWSRWVPLGSKVVPELVSRPERFCFIPPYYPNEYSLESTFSLIHELIYFFIQLFYVLFFLE